MNLPPVLCLPLLLAGCAVSAPPAQVGVDTPAAWRSPHAPQTPQALLTAAAVSPEAPEALDAPVAHGGQSAQLLAWWQQWNDALLVRLQDQAQQASPSVAAAATRVAQARHAVVASGAASGPALSASAGVARAVSYVGTPAATQASAGLNVSWEADLWGGQQASAHAADQRLQASQAQWHEARVAVAAEVARQYTQLRLCQQVLDIQRADAQSREVMARLSAQRTRAGFESPANAALAQASAAQGRMAVTQQHAQCEAALQGLVALSALTANDSASLSAPLDQSSGALWSAAAAPAIASASVQADPLALPLVLPAALLAQRPDVFAAQRSVAAASADVGSAQADRYPRLGLSGQITAVHTRGSGNDQTWSIGPLQISLPLWDGGRRASQVTVQQAAYDEAVVAYRASVRNAVREVEQALLALNSATARQADAAVATQGFERALQAAADRQRAGLGSLLELEDTRRSALAAQLALAQLHADRLLAWVDLYRAFGGGWSTAVATSLAVPHLPASSDQTPSPNPSIEATR